jgi:hypothetical protein
VKIAQLLTKLGKRISRKYKTINFGGCCVYASIVADELNKRGVGSSIIVCAEETMHNTNGGGINEARLAGAGKASRHTWLDHGVYFGHVGVEVRVGNVYFHHDVTTTSIADTYFNGDRIYAGRLTVTEAATLAADPNGWNPTFNRNAIPALKRDIADFFDRNFTMTTITVTELVQHFNAQARTAQTWIRQWERYQDTVAIRNAGHAVGKVAGVYNVLMFTLGAETDMPADIQATMTALNNVYEQMK